MTKIDVLAVMDSIASAYQELGAPITAKAVREARAAVANLIEAANFLKITLTTDHPVETDFEESLHRFTDALARIGGAA